ncbi:MAG: hypothetical protein AB8H80_21690 [Planctomycetota bacterium]
MARFAPALSLMVGMAMFGGCDNSSSTGALGQNGGRPALVSVDVGRLVDVFAFRRIDPSVGSRLRRTNRRIELIESNVIVNSNLASESLFDAGGNELLSADYEFLPFNKEVGHEQLLILWDDTSSDRNEAANFERALAEAQTGLSQLPPSFRNQNTQNRPIPIVPRNAAFRLNFSSQLNLDDSVFATNPSLVQLLEFQGDPDVVDPVNAFRILPYRATVKEDTIILDTTILGGEAEGGITSSGLPLSSDNVTANIRLAIPSRGEVVSSFFVDRDGVSELNGPDSAGRQSVIRDFRSGNLLDGVAGRLSEPEPPFLVGVLPMGITGVDATNNIVTINKRLRFVPIRARYPFVDGPLDTSDMPLGPLSVPTQRPLQYGDILTQDVTVQLDDGSFEIVQLRAEVLENLSIQAMNVAGVGEAINAPPGDSGQGETIPQVQLRLATVQPGRDSDGNLVSFRANPNPEGEECLLRSTYVEEVPFSSGSSTLTDRNWRNLFLAIEPSSQLPGVDIAPNASLALEFTKPMDLDLVDSTSNLVITNTSVLLESFTEQMSDPKRATTRVVPTRLTDLEGDGTVLRLQPPLGFAHEAGTAEVYSLHIRVGTDGVADLAGNTLEIYGDVGNPQDAWSVDFQLDPGADSNQVGWHTWRFEALDEDGTLPGSVDMFGQFRLENGTLIGASGIRFSRSANLDSLGQINRFLRGECYIGDGNTAPLAGTNGLLYQVPQMQDTVNPPNVPAVFPQVPQPVGRVIEPFKPQGSRMQLRYIEDDFNLSYVQPSEFALDVEQLYWSPFADETVLFDVFDRVSMSLSHSRRRPDKRHGISGDEECIFDCPTMNSALSVVFADNVLNGTEQVPVFEDKVYTINPNEAIRDASNTAYVPFPRFDRSYTWRDSRLVTIDENGDVIGLGGAQDPGASAPNNDVTAAIDSPWITSVPAEGFPGSTWVLDIADFNGVNQRDHDPIALPLLVDIKVFPDDAANGVALGTNAFQVALMGTGTNFPPIGPPSPGGYYDTVGSGCGGRPAWPWVRVHASGGFDQVTGGEILVDPSNVLQANAVNIVKDAGAYLLPGGSLVTGLFTAPPGDGMLPWSRADFVRRVSTVTFGFIDSLQPQRAQIVDGNGAIQNESGFPDWQAIDPNLRITEVAVQLDPPQTGQPAGTGVVVELRGCETFANSGTIYDPIFGPAASDEFDTRGNLLNPNYASEAFRYSTPNVNAQARIATTGLTPYFAADDAERLRDPATGVYPRFLNPRLVMTNNIDVSPALSPTLRFMSIAYRLAPGQ